MPGPRNGGPAPWEINSRGTQTNGVSLSQKLARKPEFPWVPGKEFPGNPGITGLITNGPRPQSIFAARLRKILALPGFPLAGSSKNSRRPMEFYPFFFPFEGNSWPLVLLQPSILVLRSPFLPASFSPGACLPVPFTPFWPPFTSAPAWRQTGACGNAGKFCL